MFVVDPKICYLQSITQAKIGAITCENHNLTMNV